MNCTSYYTNSRTWEMLLQRRETLIIWTVAIKSTSATIWPQGLCLPVTILSSLTSHWYFPVSNPKAWTHSLFANKMVALKEKTKSRDREEIAGCSLHQLFWRIKLRPFNSGESFFFKLPGGIWSSRIKAGVKNIIHPTHMKARQICLGPRRQLDMGEQSATNENTAPFNS